MPDFLRKLCFAALLLTLSMHPFLYAEQDRPATESIATDGSPTPAVAVEEVKFDYEIEDGLYATITCMQSFKKPEIKNEKKFRLKNIDGFKKEVEVRALLQDKPAPLVVI